MNYEENIGKRVEKSSSGKPFKSGLHINTVKGVINHPILNIPAYTFEEDESYVECRRCGVVSGLTELQKEILDDVRERGTTIVNVETGLGKGEKLPTHEVLDLVYHEEEGNVAFQGTQQECQDWITDQGGATFTYKTVPIIKR